MKYAMNIINELTKTAATTTTTTNKYYCCMQACLHAVDLKDVVDPVFEGRPYCSLHISSRHVQEQSSLLKGYHLDLLFLIVMTLNTQKERKRQIEDSIYCPLNIETPSILKPPQN